MLIICFHMDYVLEIRLLTCCAGTAHGVFKPLIQCRKLGLLQVFRHVRIDIQSRFNVRMAQCVLDHLHIDAGFAHPGGKGMPQGMTAEMREQYLGIRVLAQYCIITVPGNPADRLKGEQ